MTDFWIVGLGWSRKGPSFELSQALQLVMVNVIGQVILFALFVFVKLIPVAL